ncbi:MAG TPA: hypothetical protein PK389_04315 [Gammaproteobacteria bacterium]|nr:hypothetical protein [Micavibrio sp.]HQY22959.1 hypothetical protein [Gammaproteobacteria bacterium]
MKKHLLRLVPFVLFFLGNFLVFYTFEAFPVTCIEAQFARGRQGWNCSWNDGAALQIAGGLTIVLGAYFSFKKINKISIFDY